MNHNAFIFNEKSFIFKFKCNRQKIQSKKGGDRATVFIKIITDKILHNHTEL